MTPRSAELCDPVTSPDPAAGLSREEAAQYAAQLEREQPGYAAALGLTVAELAVELAGPGLSVEESVAAGWLSAAEGRAMLGQATPEDLAELGYPADETRAILLRQQDQACASSG